MRPPGALAAAPPSALLLFTQAGEPELAAVPGLSIGIVSSAQGTYTSDQLMLDIGQGARIASSAYTRSRPPPLSLRQAAGGGEIEGWAAAVTRARAAPQLLSPGALAGAIGSGAGYAGVAGEPTPGAAAAANPAGRIASVSLASVATLPDRITALSHTRRLVVADLPDGPVGLADLRALVKRRGPGELTLVLQRAGDPSSGALLWAGVAGLRGGGGRELSSSSTNERGLIVSVDLAPSILQHLGLATPPAMRGRAIVAAAHLDSGGLRALMARLRVIGGRRLKALAFLLLGWALLLLLACAVRRGRATVARVGAIGVLWTPVASLITAALEPSAPVEYLSIALACVLLGAATDRLLAWPRAMIAPALGAVVALGLDALAHTQLLMRSLLGPNPLLGARFYGIGNELKSGLAVLVLAAVAGALYPAARGRRSAGWTIAAGIVLALLEGSARIGAGVGGVILVSAGFAVAAVLLAGGELSRGRAMVVMASPLVALVVLAALDLATAHGSGHFTGSILHARSPGDIRDVIVRRYEAAWGELRNHTMPIATGVALLCGAAGIRRRGDLLAPVEGDPAWLAALAGGLAAGLVGALVEDSGPVLLVVAVFALGCVCSYLWAAPLSSGTPDTRRGSRSRARRRPAENVS